jgi:predicted DNA-binding transcriptional regulator YafY
MSRAARLLDLIQALRRHRAPVSGGDLARELGISLRTLYRDIATLQAQGAHIEGEPGLGYVLRPGFMLPPLMFSDEEIEALVLGSRWVAERGDDDLGQAARNALAKIAAVLPPDLREFAETATLLIAPTNKSTDEQALLAIVRKAIRRERKIEIAYRDGKAGETRRTVWPFALGFFETVRIVAAWCELRQDFRHFRIDRTAAAVELDQRYPHRRAALLKAWRKRQSIPAGA